MTTKQMKLKKNLNNKKKKSKKKMNLLRKIKIQWNNNQAKRKVPKVKVKKYQIKKINLKKMLKRLRRE